MLGGMRHRIGRGLDAFRGFARGALEAVGIAALFVAGGLGWAAALNGGALPEGSAEPALYRPDVEHEQPAAPPRIWLVDGYNVLAVGLLAGREREGWWSARFRDELLGRAAAFDERDAEIWVVFDGQAAQVARSEAKPSEDQQASRAQRGEAERRSDRGTQVRSVFAPSADDWLLDRIRERGADRVALVTADRSLADRARHRGAEVVAPAAFLARCRATG